MLFLCLGSCKFAHFEVTAIIIDSAHCNYLVQEDNNLFEISLNDASLEAMQIDYEVICKYGGISKDDSIPPNNFVCFDSIRFEVDDVLFYGKMYNDSIASSIQGYRENYLLLRNNRNDYIACIVFDSIAIANNRIQAYVYFRAHEWVTTFVYCNYYKQFVSINTIGGQGEWESWSIK